MTPRKPAAPKLTLSEAVGKFIAGLDPKLISLVALSVIGSGINTARQVESAKQETAEVRQQVAKQDTAQARTRGRMRAEFRAHVVKDSIEKVELRREIRSLKRVLASLPKLPAPSEPVPAPIEYDEDSDPMGPEPAPAKPAGVKGLIAKPFKALGRLFGGG